MGSKAAPSGVRERQFVALRRVARRAHLEFYRPGAPLLREVGLRRHDAALVRSSCNDDADDLPRADLRDQSGSG